MSTNSRLPGFTLSELIVVLVLTGIIVGLVFSVLSLVNRHMSVIRGNFVNQTEMQKLEQVLWLDFNRYNRITFEPDTRSMLLATPIDSLTYRFTEQAVLRGTDTIPVRIKRVRTYFNGADSGQGQIDALKLENKSDLPNGHVFVFKKNDAASYMN